MARTYHRDANGRFASGGGGGSSRPARKAAPTRAGNRLNRDNAGKITGVGKDGATARGGRIRTASGKQRATQTARMAGAARSGTVGKGGKAKAGRPSGWRAVPKDRLKQYRMLDGARRRLKQQIDRDGSVMTGSQDRRRSAAAGERFSLGLRKVRRIEQNMRKMSNSPDSPNVPTLPRASKTGERITGPLSIYGRKTPTTRAARPAGTMRKRPRPAAAPAPTGTRTRSQAKAAQSSRRNQILDRTRGWSRNPGLKRSDTGMRQLSLTGPAKTLFSYKPTKLRRR